MYRKSHQGKDSGFNLSAWRQVRRERIWGFPTVGGTSAGVLKEGLIIVLGVYIGVRLVL